MRILFAAAPAYGLMLPVVPLVWAARAAGHEVLVATTSQMVDVGSRAGLPIYDVFTDRDVWADLVGVVMGPDEREVDYPGVPADELRLARAGGNPFGLFLSTMAPGTLAVGRRFAPDLVVTTSDHLAGSIAAAGLGVPCLEVGNRVSWSTRDAAPDGGSVFAEGELGTLVRRRLGIGDDGPELLARIDPRAPSMGGLPVGTDDVDHRDGVPWWSMQYVPYNGGAVVPDWALDRPARPRVSVTLGTVVPGVGGVGVLGTVLAALGSMDVEVVLAAGTADLAELGELPDNVDSVGYLALSAFLPSCSVIIHHGGSGTTAAPLFYGVPQLVVPSFADNPLSAKRVADRGVGLSHDPKTVDADTVRSSVQRLLDDPSFSTAAAEVRTEMLAQPSPATIISRLEETLAAR